MDWIKKYALKYTKEYFVRWMSDIFTDSKVHGANMGPTWVLSAPDGPHAGPMNLAIRVVMWFVDIPYKKNCSKVVRRQYPSNKGRPILHRTFNMPCIIYWYTDYGEPRHTCQITFSINAMQFYNCSHTYTYILQWDYSTMWVIGVALVIWIIYQKAIWSETIAVYIPRCISLC